MYRNPKILNEARWHPCQALGCGRGDGTVVAAHSNLGRHGKGRGIKASDVFVAFLCNSCHSFVDQGRASAAARESLWMAAHLRTVHILRTLGLLDPDAESLLAADSALGAGNGG